MKLTRNARMRLMNAAANDNKVLLRSLGVVERSRASYAVLNGYVNYPLLYRRVMDSSLVSAWIL